MTETDRDGLREIKTFPSLVKYLRDELDWPIESTDAFDDLTFDYQPEELGIDAKAAAKIKDIKQLRPLSSGQPWGIFFINFEPKRLPVVVLRRVLRSLVIKRRQSAQKAEQPTWHLHDLLFISSYGKTHERAISFANFSEGSQPSDLPTLRVLAWDDKDTVLHLGHAHETLKEKLRWPGDESNHQAWQETWSSAFVLRPREVITTSKKLAVHMAGLATQIRNRANTILAVETESGPLRKLHKGFQEALIHDLSEDDFADMYAQTITYGLFAAACSRPAGLVGDNLAEMVPVTNPFLKELLATFLEVAGRRGHIDFDELGVNDVLELLLDADLEAVKRDFGDRRREEDPVIHFYELFLGEYDRRKKVQRGVFYTPHPVVSFIVRSVHEILETEFGLEDGLADTSTWGEMVKRTQGLELPRIIPRKSQDGPDVTYEPIDPETPFVQILDPACGTGTFLVEVIDMIHKTMRVKWEKEGHLPLEFDKLWNEYVPKHLLPRLYGFELMMAPYTIAHMKLGLKLDETGYRFGSSERLRVYLTNSLEPPHDFSDTFQQMAPALAHEARAANGVKTEVSTTIIMGNPPYSVSSSNQGSYIEGLMDSYKQLVRSERNIQPLSDDYIKFIRRGHEWINKTGVGVIGLITNHSYLSGLIHRGMRQELMKDFSQISVADLHGNIAMRERSPGGEDDENVFDIQQGVAITFLRRQARSPGALARVRHCDIWGARQQKYAALADNDFSVISWQAINPEATPMLFFVPKALGLMDEYERGHRISDVQPIGAGGIKTRRDHLLLDFDKGVLLDRFAEIATNDNIEELKSRYSISDTKYWTLEEAKRRIRLADVDSLVRHYSFRPFDTRYIYYNPDIIERGDARWSVMRHFFEDNVSLLVMRQVAVGEGYTHFLVSRNLCDNRMFYSNRGILHVIPQYLYADPGSLHRQSDRVPNLAPGFANTITKVLELAWIEDGRGDPGFGGAAGPVDVLHYIYAQFHSQTYRDRYLEFLKMDFPRVFLTENLPLFRSLCQLGADLVALHLLEDDYEGSSWDAGDGPLTRPFTRFVSEGQAEVAKGHPKYEDGKVYINKACYFDGVPEEVWNFCIGGYQVCRKWLKDRGPKKGKPGRVLSDEDIDHYEKIVVALNETIRIMKEIDKVIDAHGGWPDAFVTEKQ